MIFRILFVSTFLFGAAACAVETAPGGPDTMADTNTTNTPGYNESECWFADSSNSDNADVFNGADPEGELHPACEGNVGELDLGEPGCGGCSCVQCQDEYCVQEECNDGGTAECPGGPFSNTDPDAGGPDAQ
jgi:hypothetical protein